MMYLALADEVKELAYTVGYAHGHHPRVQVGTVHPTYPNERTGDVRLQCSVETQNSAHKCSYLNCRVLKRRRGLPRPDRKDVPQWNCPPPAGLLLEPHNPEYFLTFDTGQVGRVVLSSVEVFL
jgi:hypothetical protein